MERSKVTLLQPHTCTHSLWVFIQCDETSLGNIWIQMFVIREPGWPFAIGAEDRAGHLDTDKAESAQ